MDQEARDRIAAHRKRLSGHTGTGHVPRQQAEAIRYDWFAEAGPCVYRTDPEQRLACGCGNGGIVIAKNCGESPETKCVANQAQRASLLKNHRKLYDTVRVCEDCFFRKEPD